MPRETKIDWTRVNNDVNGNSRYVLHWIAIGDTYQQALEIGRKYGGRKYHNKSYGGGIVFKSKDLDGLEEALLTHAVAYRNSIIQIDELAEQLNTQKEGK